MLCSICNKNTAVIFINKQMPDKSIATEGLCYECAKKKGVNPLEALSNQANISEEDIMWYVSHEKDLLKKAGYSLEGTMSLLLEKSDGDYYNVLGLPLGMLYSKINEMGYSLKDFE